MKKPPLHPLAGALLVLLGGLGLSALPLLPLALPPLPAPLGGLPGSVLLGGGVSLLAALGVAWRLRAARRRMAEQRAEHDTLAFEQEGLLQHLAELGEKAQRDAEFAASTEAALREELAAQAERLLLIDGALLRIELDAQGRLLTPAKGLEPGTSLHLGAGAHEAMLAARSWCGPLALPDGEVMLLRLQPLGGERFLGLGLPQTALWRQRAELQQAFERQREQLDGAQAGGWGWQLGTERVQLDRRALKLFGLPAAGSVEMEAARLTERFHDEDLPRWRAALHRLMAGRDSLLHLQLRVRRGDGHAWLQLRGAVVARDASGQALRLAGTLIGIDAALETGRRELLLEQIDSAVQQGLGAAGFAWLPDEDCWTWNTAAAALLRSVELPPRLRLEQALQAIAAAQREAAATLLLRIAGGGDAAEIALSLQDGLGGLRAVRLRAWMEQGRVIGLLATVEREQLLQRRVDGLNALLQAMPMPWSARLDGEAMANAAWQAAGLPDQVTEDEWVDGADGRRYQLRLGAGGLKAAWDISAREHAHRAELAPLREQLERLQAERAQQAEQAELARRHALQLAAPMPEPVLSPQQLQQANAQGIALQKGVARFQGRIGLYLRSAQAFVGMAQGLPAQLRSKDDEASQLALHSFKGLAATLGCERLAQWGAAGEQRLRGGQAIDADWLRAFEEQLAEGLALLRSLAEPPPVPAAAPRPDWLQTLEQGIADADPLLAGWLAAQRDRLAPWLGEDLERLAEALAVNDFGAARALLAARALS